MGPSVVWVSFKGSSSVLSPLCPASRSESLPEGRSPLEGAFSPVPTGTYVGMSRTASIKQERLGFKGGVYVTNCAAWIHKAQPTLLWYGHYSHYMHSITIIDYKHESVPGDCMSLALCSTTSSPCSHRFNSLFNTCIFSLNSLIGDSDTTPESLCATWNAFRYLSCWDRIVWVFVRAALTFREPSSKSDVVCLHAGEGCGQLCSI